MTLRNRTGTETTDHVQLTLDRERLTTPGEGATVDPSHTARKKAVKPSTSEQMENCEVCGRSFVKGRGLSIHQTKAGCKKIMESRKSKSKSTNSGLQDSNHSDSTKELFHDSPVLKDEVSPNQGKKTTPVKNRIDPSKSNQQSENTHVRRKDQEERLIEKTLPLEKDNTPEQSQDQLEKVKAPEKVLCGAKKKYPMDIRRFCEIKKRMSKDESSKLTTDAESKERGELSMKATRSKCLRTTTKDIDHQESQIQEVLIISDEESNEEEKRTRPEDGSTSHQQDIRAWLDKEKGTNIKSKDMFKRLVEQVNSGPPDDIISKHTLEMSRRDYRSLTGKNWMNDKIVDEYFTLIKERNQKDNLAKVSTFSVHAFRKLEQDFEENFQLIADRWVKEDLTMQDIVLIPIYKDDHWSLVKVSIKDKKLEYYDSIVARRHTSNALRILKKFFDLYFERKGKEGQFQKETVDNAPEQHNLYDCGPFMCQNAEKAARGVFVNSKQSEMARVRRQMMIEIFQGALMKEENLSFKTLLDQVTNTEVKKEKHQKTERQREKKKPKQKTGSKATKPDDKDRLAKINWPKANSKEWERLDEDITGLLKTIYSGPDKKAKSHPKIIYEICKERFGLKEGNEKSKQGGPSRRQLKCKRLREEINILKKTYQEAPEEEKAAIQELNKEKGRALRLAKWAEANKQSRKKFAANCQQFLSQPYKFARELLKPKPKGCLESTQEEVERHLKEAHSNPKKREREQLNSLLKHDEPNHQYNDAPPTYKEFTAKLRKTRSKSAPGPNGVPYLVYKRCQGVAKQLWFYLRELWKKMSSVMSREKQRGYSFLKKREPKQLKDLGRYLC